MRPVVLALAGAVALGGCAADRLTLSENEEGEATGAVAILDPVTFEERAVLDTKLTEAKLTSRPKPRAVKELKPAYSELLENLPRKASRFTILFGSDETRIPADQRSRVDEIRAELGKRPPGAQIEVVGFTDRDGDADRNLAISQQRARDVIGELTALGFTIDQLDAVGRGELAAKEAGDLEGNINPLFRKVEVVIR